VKKWDNSKRRRGKIFALTKQYDTERTSQMGPAITQDQKRGVSFVGLQSRPQNYLRNHSPDISGLVNGTLIEATEKFMNEFLSVFPELSAEITDQTTMRRLMRAGVQARKRHQTNMRRRKFRPRYLPPTTF